MLWLSKLNLVMHCAGLALAPLYFHTGGVREFLGTLRSHALLVRLVFKHLNDWFIEANLSESTICNLLLSVQSG